MHKRYIYATHALDAKVRDAKYTKDVQEMQEKLKTMQERGVKKLKMHEMYNI